MNGNQLAVSVYNDPMKQLSTYVKTVMKDPQGTMYQYQPFVLRMYQALSTSQENYIFQLKKGISPNETPIDIRLDNNDGFYAAYMSVVIRKYVGTAGSEDYGKYFDFPYVDGNFFAGNNGEAASLNTVFSGVTTVQTKTVERLNLATDVFRMVPEHPYVINPGAGPQVAPEVPQYGPGLEAQGFFRLPDLIGFNGNDDNRITVSLGNASNYTGITGTVNSSGTNVTTRNLIGVKLFGIKIVGGSTPAIR